MGETISENQVWRINAYKDKSHSKWKIKLLKYCFNNLFLLSF